MSASSSFEPTGGDFQYTVSNAELPEPVLSDYNLLFFLSTGEFIGALAEQNTLTNRPLELGGINATVVDPNRDRSRQHADAAAATSRTASGRWASATSARRNTPATWIR